MHLGRLAHEHIIAGGVNGRDAIRAAACARPVGWHALRYHADELLRTEAGLDSIGLRQRHPAHQGCRLGLRAAIGGRSLGSSLNRGDRQNHETDYPCDVCHIRSPVCRGDTWRATRRDPFWKSLELIPMSEYSQSYLRAASRAPSGRRISLIFLPTARFIGLPTSDPSPFAWQCRAIVANQPRPKRPWKERLP